MMKKIVNELNLFLIKLTFIIIKTVINVADVDLAYAQLTLVY